MTRSLIEQWLPAGIVGAESLRERGSAKAYPPINFLHVWWARRPLAASRAAVVASLLPAWPSEEEALVDAHCAVVLAGLRLEFPGGETEYRAWFLEALGIFGDPVAGRAAITTALAANTTTVGNAYGYERAFSISPDEKTIERLQRLARLRSDFGDAPVVLDPFAGGGSIPFEAARYGCVTIANELNPVAAAILQGTVDLPARLGPEFAGTIAVWGERWADRVKTRLQGFFPLQSPDELPAFIWAHTVPCPTTGFPTPLAPDFWLSRGAAGRDVAVRLEGDRETGTCALSIVEGDDAREHGSRSTYKRGAAESIWTGETFSGDYIRRMGSEGRIGQMLLAVSITRSGVRGRQFRSPSTEDLEAVAEAEAELAQRRPAWEVDDLIPTEPIPEGWKTTEPRRMGLKTWADMFAPRQLLANVTALDELQQLVVEAQSELGGQRGRALGLYLAFALDRAVSHNSMQSRWDATRLKVCNVFERHDFGYRWSFAEFDGAHSLFPWAIANAVVNHRKISALVEREAQLWSTGSRAHAKVTLGSAAVLDLPDESVDAIVTDPPYYDNVMYAECSDYFYVWLKRSLKDTWPQFTDLALTDKEEEAVANSSLFREVAAPSRGGRRADGPSAVELADAHYEELLRRCFREANRVLKPDGVMTVMFTHKRIDAWDTLGVALLDAGFSIDASWPVHTESEHSLHQAKKNAAASTIFLTCSKRRSSEPAFWTDLRREIERVAEEAAARFAEEGITGVDLTIATFGPVLSVLSDRWPVYTGELDTEGNSVVLRPDAALDLARERVAALKMRGLLGGRQVDFDRVTDWYLLAWNDFQAVEFPYDEARKLSIATHLDLDELARHRVIRQGSGTVTIQSPAQRHSAGAIDPDGSVFTTWLDRLHALMLVYDEDGLAAARTWLGRTGLVEDARLSDLFEAALHAVPRVRDRTGFALPEARILDSMRTTLFEHVALPLEPKVPVVSQLRFGVDGDDDAGLAEDDDSDGADEV